MRKEQIAHIYNYIDILKMLKHILTVIIFIMALSVAKPIKAQYAVNYDVSFMSNAASGKFAPYYMVSNNHGIISQNFSAFARAKAWRPLSLDNRFSYAFCLDLIGGYNSATDYSYYVPSSQSFNEHALRPSCARIQQLYGEVKYRSLFATLGMKEHGSALLNQSLSSGDLVESGNSRPMPEIRIGFIDFQNIPFTNGWAQIQGEYSLAKCMDSQWIKDHYNYYNEGIATDYYYSYKRLYLRSNPTKPFSVTVGMQAAVQFGGKFRGYNMGKLFKEVDMKISFSTLLHTIIPGGAANDYSGGEYYHEGNHLGSWDLTARYKLPNNDIIKGYFQFPWEDGSGIGKLNGFDGIYGIEYQFAHKGIVNSAVIEYLDFTNQSGPMHWAPADHDGPTTIPNSATGADDYYNNYLYSAYQYYGMSIGTPFLKSPIYNTDGYLGFTDNRVRGFHLGISGTIFSPINYRLLASYRTSLGTPFIPNLEKKHSTSMLLEVSTILPKIPNLNLNAQIAFDSGNIFGNSFGVMISASYRGALNF